MTTLTNSLKDPYSTRVYSHFVGSVEKFYYCDRYDPITGARMTNVYDYADQLTVKSHELQRSYIGLYPDTRHRLGITDEIVAKVMAHFQQENL